MAGDNGFNTHQLLFFLAVIALIVGIVFHVIYLVKDRSTETAQDRYNKSNAQMFFGMAAALALVAMLLAQREGKY